jgi:5-methyltetrahydropteroyltriglutamate--homocysteine methyltransferase
VEWRPLLRHSSRGFPASSDRPGTAECRNDLSDDVQFQYAQERGEPFDQAIFEEKVRSAVRATVRQQVAVGIDVINDGEMSKISYATYVKHRLTGFSPVDVPWRSMWADLEEFPAYAERLWQPTGRSSATACTGPVSYVGAEAVQQDIANLKAALQGTNSADVFLTAASPGIISFFLKNRYYPATKRMSSRWLTR